MFEESSQSTSCFLRVQKVYDNAVHCLKCCKAAQLFINLKTFPKPGQASLNQTVPTFAFQLADTLKQEAKTSSKQQDISLDPCRVIAKRMDYCNDLIWLSLL